MTHWDIETHKTLNGLRWRAVECRTGRWLTRNQVAKYAAEINRPDDEPLDPTSGPWRNVARHLYAKM